MIARRYHAALANSAAYSRDSRSRSAGRPTNWWKLAKVLQWNFVLAAMIAYLLMASMFGNFIYPLIIMLTVLWQAPVASSACDC